MITISVTASRNYDVLIDSNLIQEIGTRVQELLHPKTAVIITDSNVGPHYLTDVTTSLLNAGITAESYTISAGESSKTLDTFCSILHFLSERRITRSDVLIALGGGVVGDLTGFVAACYLRGIAYVQVPTTLLAMVDSSVGGKTAVDLPAGKNLVGAFHQPSLVICDPNTLDTLPEDIFCDGCAEVIKYAILFDGELFALLADQGLGFDRKTVIARCIEHKRNVVAEDEFDTGKRQMLNLGHTAGHAVEKLSDLTLSHGKSVAIGMAIIARAAANLDLLSQGDCRKICDLIAAFMLPTTTEFSAQQITQCMLSDKKRFGDTVNLIIPTKIGECRIYPTPTTQLEILVKAGL